MFTDESAGSQKKGHDLVITVVSNENNYCQCAMETRMFPLGKCVSRYYLSLY